VATVLLVSDDLALAAAVARELRAHRVIRASGRAQALELAAAETVDVVYADQRLPGSTGLEVLRELHARHPTVRRLLAAAHEDLPDLLRGEGVGGIARVLSRSSAPHHVREVIEAALAGEPSARGPAPDPAPLDELADAGRGLLMWTAERIVAFPEVVIRAMAGTSPELELVVPRDQMAALRTILTERWGPPVKAVGQRGVRHPLVERLRPSREQEVFAHALGDGGFLFVGLFPWRREPRLTVLLGCAVTDEAAWRDDLAIVHRTAVAMVPELRVPAVRTPSDSVPAVPVPEYDWVVTRTYVGADRRRRPTSFLNRFLLFGRRRHLARPTRAQAEIFVDRVGPRTALAALACCLLSALDTYFTYRYVRSGTVRELNPLLRPLVHGHPWAFLAIKNLLSLTAFFVAIRLRWARVGPYLIISALLSYALVDAYWVRLLFL
jgi:DNA-binding NarL/FixJ family response regulator